jgi:protocatechuate 3,4-dioxygenase beta subunit
MNRKYFLRSFVPFVYVAVNPATINVENFKIEKCKTASDAEGPFYKKGAPSRSIIESDGDPITIEGKILTGEECTKPVAGAIIDVWHCNNDGEYDMKGYQGRGQVTSDKNGYYTFTTILPPPYGSRPRHIHFKVHAEGFSELTTQLYFEGDPNIKNDFARNAEKGRITKLTMNNGLKKGQFNIYI